MTNSLAYVLFCLVHFFNFVNANLEQTSLDEITELLDMEQFKNCEKTNAENIADGKECTTVRNALLWVIKANEARLKGNGNEGAEIPKNEGENPIKEIDELFVQKYNLDGLENEKMTKNLKETFQSQLKGLQKVNLIGRKAAKNLRKNPKLAIKLANFAQSLRQMERQGCWVEEERDVVIYTKATMLLPKLKNADSEMNEENVGKKKKRIPFNFSKRLKFLGIRNEQQQRRGKRCSTCQFLCCCFTEMDKLGERC